MSESNGLAHELVKVREELEISILKAQKESVDSYWDDFLRGSDRVPHRSSDPPSKPSDRWYGRDWPRIRTILDLDIFRSASRLVCAENAYAIGALQGIIDAVCGQGGAYDCDDKDVESYLNDWSLCYWSGGGDPWLNTPLSESNERQFLRRLLRDGEVFLYATEEEAKFLDPERCRDYSDGLEGWSYGVKTQIYPYSDVTQPEEYSFIMEMGSQTFIPASNIIHAKIDATDSTVKRGRPLFSYDVLDAFLGANRTRAAISLGARIRAKIALLWKIPYGDAQDVAALTVSTALRQTSQKPFHGRDRDNILPDGTEVFTPEGLEPAPLPQDYTNTQLESVQADLRCAGAALLIPEFMLSGDASNANYASTKEAGTPFIRHVESLQLRVKGVALRLAAKSLYYAVENNILSKEQAYKARFDYDLPSPVVTDQHLKSKGLVELVSSGILTKEEARVELGFSPRPGDMT